MNEDLEKTIEQLRIQIDEWKVSYADLQKRTSQLSAQNKMIIESATKRISQADEEIIKLQKIILNIKEKIPKIVSKADIPFAEGVRLIKNLDLLFPPILGG